MISVFHITPHLGGGVGRVLLNHLAFVKNLGGEKHTVACLEYANPSAISRADEIGVKLEEMMADHIPELFELMNQADVVVIHWWNHPLLYSLLVNESFPPVRLLLWSHVAGAFPTQNFTDDLLSFPDIFVVATPHSLEAPAVQRLKESEKDCRLRLVFTCAGIDHVKDAKPEPHKGFCVGYVGTVDYCKMHPDFVQISSDAEIPEVCFIVCGGPEEAIIRDDAIRAGVEDKFRFLGHIDNVADVLSTFDVFGYPLAPDHYGTGEQALIEALAAGIPPVVLANGAEQHIVQDGVTGIVAKTEKEYTHALEHLARDSELRVFLGTNARNDSRERFTIERMSKNWSKLYAEICQQPKKRREWRVASRDSGKLQGAELFIVSLGEHADDFIESMNPQSESGMFAADERIANKQGLFRARTRGTVFHYQKFYPDDPYLNLWCGLMLKFEDDASEARKYLAKASRSLGSGRIEPHLDSVSNKLFCAETQ